MLNVHGRLAVVVGAGDVGLRKVRSLLEAGAKVRLVAGVGGNPQSAIRNPQSDQPNGLDVIRQNYRKEHVAGAVLVFACTDDRQVNARIAADARAAGALVNAVDQPNDCDFLMPSTASDGDVMLAVGTGGAAPALAAWLRRRIAEALPERIGEFAAALAELREAAATSLPDAQERMAAMKALASEDSYREFLKTGIEGLRVRAAGLGVRTRACSL